MQWDDDEKLDETWERRRMEGSSLQLEVMQKVPELVHMNERPRVKKVNGTNEKKKVNGRSTEEMKGKAKHFFGRRHRRTEKIER